MHNTINNQDLSAKLEGRRTKRFKCSMKTCKLTSSVKIACPVPALAAEPYMLADMCVVDGFNFDRRKRA